MKKWTPEEIKKFRERHNLYQRDLALMLGVTRQYVIYLEKGVRTPSNTLRLLLDCIAEKHLKENEKGKGVKYGKRNL